MIYGNPQVKIENDTTDLIGIRRLVLSQRWQPSGGGLTISQMDAETPGIPAVPSGVILIGRQTRLINGNMLTTWTFEGVDGDGKSVTFKGRTNSLDYGFEAGFSQVSIQRHPDFQTLLASYGGFPDNDGSRVIWPSTIPTASASGGGLGGTTGGTTTNPMFGINDFLQMEGTYRFRYAAQTLPSTVLSNVGKIFTTGLPGVPPALTGDRNWLSAPPNYRHRGTIFDITEIYWMSGPGGWPTPVYGSANATDNGSPTLANNPWYGTD